MNEEEFLRQDFSLNEYLGKILADSSGECSRLKDKHIRILSKHSEALSEEVLHKKDKIRDGLVTLSLLIQEAKRISKELPDLFLPLSEGSSRKIDNEMHKELEDEIEKMNGDPSLARGRVLKHKEIITIKIDGEVHSGILLISEDIIVIGVDDKSTNGREFYNALLIKEVSCDIEESVLAISLPPVRVEIVKAESAFKDLRSKIFGGRSRDRKTAKTPNKLPNVEITDTVDNLEYKNYLLRIGRLESIENPSIPDIIAEIRSIYRMSEWKGCTSLLKLLKKMSPVEAVKLYCEIEGHKITKTITGIVHTRETCDAIIEKLHELMKNYIRAIEKVFPESDASPFLSLHLESIHQVAAEMVYKLFYQSDSKKDLMEGHNTLTDKLKKAFEYDGYSYGYTVKVENEIKKSVLKERYIFNKHVMSYVFKKV
ncbi:hypothetical protein NEMIN01_1981 [Nematocida minor]|uniref:uncharacterized protein n=1 Tax=Nematocida minor TaxID=1912983 RepID=UPI00221E8C02|nr:uncharacterized protein NEMIN01_1981 [Nematocida minor]KAI5192367.1 hypothetical protein NEMIN01_1981 [Nematocida minor]